MCMPTRLTASVITLSSLDIPARDMHADTKRKLSVVRTGAALMSRYGMEVMEVVSGTHAAATPRHWAGHRLLASLVRVLAGWANASHRRPYSSRYYLERARLSREMDRL